MSEELVQSVQDMLKEETWTRATISNYTKNNLIELATIVEKAKNENCINEIKAICDEHLTHTKDSIIALYISGMLGLKQGTLDNSSLMTLVDIFANNHKEPIVIYLCESILVDDPSNRFALHTLADIYKADGNEEYWKIYEQIVKIDFEEADIARALAEHYDSLGDKETSIDYYKKALLRYVSKKNYNSTKDVWSLLVGLIPDEIDFFLLVQRKIAKTISEDKSAILMQELYVHYKDIKNWDVAIDILKLILQIDPKDPWARREIADCYKNKYADHSHVNDYIKSSDLTSNFRNVFEAINDFEKHIAFDAKNFVYHKTWGVGIIRSVENEKLTINFGKKNGIHEISLKMAVNALQPLSRSHIWVKKATARSKDELVKFVKENKAETLKIIIKSFDNCCDIKRIKAELVPSILDAKEWTTWNSSAKKILESDASFGVNPNNINEYTVKNHEISPEEKLSNEFKAQKQFFSRIDILMKFVNDDATDKESELFVDMYNYFTGFLKAASSVNEQIVASYLVVQRIGAMYPSHKFTTNFTFEQMYREIESPRAMYHDLKDTKNTNLKSDFLKNIKDMLPDWVDQYIKLFPVVLEKDMLTILINAGHMDKVQKLAVDSFNDFRGYRDAILFFFDKCGDEDWFKEAGIPFQKQLIALVNIISQSYKEIDNHVESTENKKIIRNCCKMLFEKDGNKYAKHMVDDCDIETMTHMYTLVDDISELDGSYKTMLRNKILAKYPDYKFHTTEEKSVQPKGMIVTAKKLEEKKALEVHLQTVDIPANAIELAEARAKGDLKENAEYIAAKEAQHKLGHDLKRLQEDLARAVVFDPTTATASFISFGTDVVLFNKDSGKEEKYTILGPWESDPENGILSYMSPFGTAILDKKVGDELSFKINEKQYHYDVKSIKLSKV
ncbi:transcription elongation factor GreA [Treponema zioleckii]|uniref:transcription elongation factor GreA n=1 Tax=Treponema zioleckii TaxID=331680 RepID=UPI00168A518E|nr:transcription elongation factor GreA [Treponema zioleckii]